MNCLQIFSNWRRFFSKKQKINILKFEAVEQCSVMASSDTTTNTTTSTNTTTTTQPQNGKNVSAKQKQQKKRSFNEAETELVISLWQNYPCLYSKNSSLFKDQNQREICRIEIAEKLKEILKEGDEPLTSK